MNTLAIMSAMALAHGASLPPSKRPAGGCPKCGSGNTHIRAWSKSEAHKSCRACGHQWSSKT